MEYDVKEINKVLTPALVAAFNARSHPVDGESVFDSVVEAFQESGAESRMSGDFVCFAFAILRATLEAGRDDQNDQGQFYADEARYVHSDHKPAECRRWSKGHVKAANVHHDALAALVKLEAKFKARIAKCDL